MADTLRIKRRTSGSPGAPSALANAELAFNEVDRVLYYGLGGSPLAASMAVPIAGTGAFLPLSAGSGSPLTGDLYANAGLRVSAASNFYSDLLVSGVAWSGTQIASAYELLAQGNKPISQSGAHLAWNRTGGAGETDFINQMAGGSTGGFRWYEATTSNVATELMRLSNGALSLLGASNVSLNINAGPGAYNNITQSGDDLLVFTGPAGLDTGALTITGWGNIAFGLRLDNAAHTITASGSGLISNAPATLYSGLSFGSQGAASPTDLSKHISLWGGYHGFSITSARLNYVVPNGNAHYFIVNGADMATIDINGLTANAMTAGYFHNVGATDLLGAINCYSQVKIYTPASDASGQLWLAPPNQANTTGVATISKIGFSGNFQNNADGGARYITSIRSGMTSAWGTEYLDIWVNNGAANDTASDANQSRVARFQKGSLTVDGQIAALDAIQVTPGPNNMAQLSLSAPTNSTSNIMGFKAGSNRWLVQMPDGGAESGGNSGSNFAIHRYADDRSYLGNPFLIVRQSGLVYCNNALCVNGPTYLNGGVSFGQQLASLPNDFSKHISIYDGFGGLSVQANLLNVYSSGNLSLYGNSAVQLTASSGGVDIWNLLTAHAGIEVHGGARIDTLTGLSTPVNPSDAATKQYVDGRARYYLNVKNYGATGNGSTDDIAAINAAISAAAGSGDTVFFPAGTYRITSEIILTTKVSVMGSGAATIIAPANPGQKAIWVGYYSLTEADIEISALTIAPTVGGCVGVGALFAKNLHVSDCTFVGCDGNSIDFDRCEDYSIVDCLVRSTNNYRGGRVKCYASTWTVSGGGPLTKDGLIQRVTFTPGINAALGHADPVIWVSNGPGVHVRQCSLAWGAYGGGYPATTTNSSAPITFILIEGQCQGNMICDNSALGVNAGIVVGVSTTYPDSLCPTYLTIKNNTVDSFGGIGVFLNGTATWKASYITISGNYITEPQRMATGATVASGGAGYVVGDLLSGPTPLGQEEGGPVLLQVLAIGGGGSVTSVGIYNAGLTQRPPANPVAFSGGHGSGATFNLTWPSNAGSAIWMANAEHCIVSENVMQTYGGVRTGFGIVMQTVTNTQIVDNQVTSFSDAIYGFDTSNTNIVFSRNILTDNSSSDFGGNPPQYSILQDNLGQPWITTTPAMPANGIEITNTAPYPQQIIITGGVVYGVTYMGVPVAMPGGAQYTTPIVIMIRPQHRIAVSYTTAPTWTWIPML